MTPTERSLLDDLMRRLSQAGSVARDPDAAAAIQAGMAHLPDAPYLLVQRCLLLERALAAAEDRIAQLSQAGPGGAQGSFLGGDAALEPGFGRAPSQAYSPAGGGLRTDVAPAAGGGWSGAAQSPTSAVHQPFGQPASQPTRTGGWRERLFGAQATGQAPMGYAPQPMAASAGPSFLGAAASTAAGVAGGMFLAQGLSHMFGHDHDGAGQRHALADSGANASQDAFGGAMRPSEDTLRHAAERGNGSGNGSDAASTDAARYGNAGTDGDDRGASYAYDDPGAGDVMPAGGLLDAGWPAGGGEDASFGMDPDSGAISDDDFV